MAISAQQRAFCQAVRHYVYPAVTKQTTYRSHKMATKEMDQHSGAAHVYDRDH